MKPYYPARGEVALSTSGVASQLDAGEREPSEAANTGQDEMTLEREYANTHDAKEALTRAARHRWVSTGAFAPPIVHE